MEAPSIVILGLGTPYLSDDAVGLVAAVALAARLPAAAACVRQSTWGGLRLLELVEGFERAVILDAITWRRGEPGTIYELPVQEAIPTVRATGYHDLSLRDALGFGHALGLPLPREIVFFAVEAADTTTYGEQLSPEVAAAVPELVRRVEDRLRAWGALEVPACTKPASPCG